MNGKIMSFSRQGASGAIQSAEGGRFSFDTASVLAYDVPGLSTGQAVNFEPDGGTPPKAINVSVLPPTSVHYSEDRYREMRRLRYVGFDQQLNIRTYRFERSAPGGPTESFVVTTDMVLFNLHKLKIQDGPALCLYLLTSMVSGEPTVPQSSPYLVTQQIVLDFLTSRAEPVRKQRARGVPGQ